jgi:proteasome beta subunit
LTTTVAIVCDDDGSLVVGSESQATAGFFIASNTATKVYKITDYIAMTISGGVADCQKIVDQLRALAQLRIFDLKKQPTVRSIAKLTSVILAQNRVAPYLAALIVGGVDTTGSHIYTLDALGSLIEEKEFASTGSGSPIAYGVLESEYRKGLSLKEGIDLIKRAISSARKRDAGSGGEFQIITITNKGVTFVG